MPSDLTLKIDREFIIKNKMLLIGVGIGLIGLWHGYNGIYKDTVGMVNQVKAQASTEVEKSLILKRLEGLQKEALAYRAYFAKEKERDILWLTNTVSNMAKRAGLEIISLTPQPLLDKNDFAYGRVAISANGTFHKLGDFVSYIEGSREFLHIEGLSFKKNGEVISVNIAVAAYFWKG